MLDELFNEPSSKLKNLLKLFFVLGSIIVIVFILILNCKGINFYSFEYFIKTGLLKIIIAILESIFFLIYNYLLCLFMYMLISFFEDIHIIASKKNSAIKFNTNKENINNE